MFLGFNLFLFFDRSSPILENRHSLGTDVAGISKYFEASLAIVGNFFDFPSTIQVGCFFWIYYLL